jgi:hypothetical protein
MGIRTPGLVIANDALYQLSYTPERFFGALILTGGRDFSNTLAEALDLTPRLLR